MENDRLKRANEKVEAAELLVSKIQAGEHIDFRRGYVSLDGGFSIEDIEACIVVLKATQAKGK